MDLNRMITRLGVFSTLLKNASEEKQRNFFRAFFAAHSSLQNPQAQAQAVTALNTQVLILGVNNYEVINTTEALLNLANLLNPNTANLIALGDVDTLNCAASSKLMGREDLSKLLNDFFPTPQQQGLQSFTTIIDHLIASQVVMQDHLMTAGEVVNSALAPTPAQAQYSCAAAAAEPTAAQYSCAAAAAEPTAAQYSCAAAAAEPTTPRTNNNEARSSTTPPPAPSRPPSVELPPLPQAMLQALVELTQRPFLARQLDGEKKDKGR